MSHLKGLEMVVLPTLNPIRFFKELTGIIFLKVINSLVFLLWLNTLRFSSCSFIYLFIYLFI